MRRRQRWLKLGTVAAVAVAAALAAGMLWPGDASRIRGAWVGDGVRLTFLGDVVALEWRESGKTERHHFRLDPAASPARIVTFDADSPSVRLPVRVFNIPLGRPSAGSAGAECRGIYELRGDRLRLCLPRPGKGFPAGFDPAAGKVFELRRE